MLVACPAISRDQSEQQHSHSIVYWQSERKDQDDRAQEVEDSINSVSLGRQVSEPRMVMYCIWTGVNCPSRHNALWFNTQRTTASLLPGGLPGGVQAYKLPPPEEAATAVAALPGAADGTPSCCCCCCCCCEALFRSSSSSKEAEEAPRFAPDDTLVDAVAGLDSSCRNCSCDCWTNIDEDPALPELWAVVYIWAGFASDCHLAA